MVNAVESFSTHPVTSAIKAFAGEIDVNFILESIEEIPALGLRALINSKQLLVGSLN